MEFIKKLKFWKRRDVVAEFKGIIHGLNKQVEETADMQEQSEDNFRGHITELEKEVQWKNIEIKQVKAMLGGRITALEVKMEERVSQREELEATPPPEEEFKARSPEMKELEATEELQEGRPEMDKV